MRHATWATPAAPRTSSPAEGGAGSFVISHSEDQQVQPAGEEAEHTSVEEQQPFVLLDRRAQHLDEIVRAHLVHLVRDELADLARLSLVERRVTERYRRERARLRRHR